MSTKAPRYSILLSVLLLAFCFRAFVLFQAPAPQRFEKYLILGQQLLESALIAERPFSYSPIYCYFIAFSKAIFGNFTNAILFVQILIGAFSCLFLFLIAYRLCGTKGAWVCFAMSCCYHSFVLYEITFLSDFLGLFLSVFIVWSIYWIWDKKSITYWIIPGILIGFAILQRTNYLLLAALILPLAYFQQRSLSLFIKKAALFISCSLIILFPIILQNMWLIGEPGITVSNPGYIFYSSNNYKNVGVLYHPPHVLLQREYVADKNRRSGKEASRYNEPFQGDAELSQEISSIITGKKMNLQQSSQFYLEYAWHYISQYPREAFVLLLQKFWFIFHGYESHDVISVIMHAPLVKILTPFAYWWIAPLGILGFFLSLQEWRKWVPLYLVLIHQVVFMMIFYVVSRFRLPVEGMMILFAVFALKKIYIAMMEKQKKALAFMAVSMVCFLLLCNTANNNMQEHIRETYLDSHLSMAMNAVSEKKYKEAFDHFQNVLEQENRFSQRAMDCYRHLSILYANMGMQEESQTAFALSSLPLEQIIAALEAQRRSGEITFNQKRGLADLYTFHKQYDKAQILLQESLDVKASHPEVRYELACLQKQAGQLIEAQKNLEIAIKNGLLFTQNSLIACYYLGEIYEKQKQPQKARKYYEQALRQKDIVSWYGIDESTKSILKKLQDARN